jgi:SAM-dependent methyltransferase
MAGPKPELIVRRSAYQFRLHAPDYFVLRNLSCFLHGSISRQVTRGNKVADVGCGEQPLRRWIEGRGAQYTGIDVCQNASNSVEVVASILNLPIDNNTFDVVYCTEVLEHVSDMHVAFREITRILRPGGVLVISVPFAYPLHEEPFDYWRITPHKLTEQASEYGLKMDNLIVSGNEIELMATIWCNMWSRLSANESMLWRLWKKLMRTPVNLLALVLSMLLNRYMPKKYFLHTFVEMRKLH